MVYKNSSQDSQVMNDPETFPEDAQNSKPF